jgi:hypothetical protein
MKQFVRCRLILPLLASAAVILAGVGQAHAEILLTLAGGAPTSNNNGTFTYSYNVFLTGGSELDKKGASDTAGSMFTLYDLTGYVAGSAKSNATGFGQSGVTEQFLGTTPSKVALADSPNLKNVTFNYTSAAATNDGSGSPNMFLGTVSFVSTDGKVGSSNITYASGVHGQGPNSPSVDVRQVAGPLAMHMPAPPTLVMLGSGLPLLGVAFLRRRKLFLTIA